MNPVSGVASRKQIPGLPDDPTPSPGPARASRGLLLQRRVDAAVVVAGRPGGSGRRSQKLTSSVSQAVRRARPSDSVRDHAVVQVAAVDQVAVWLGDDRPAAGGHGRHERMPSLAQGLLGDDGGAGVEAVQVKDARLQRVQDLPVALLQRHVAVEVQVERLAEAQPPGHHSAPMQPAAGPRQAGKGAGSPLRPLYAAGRPGRTRSLVV